MKGGCIPGDRVGAMMSADKEEVHLFGYGTYRGEEVPPADIRMWGVDLSELGHENPKILLDNGKVVWGCECWWGDEEQVRKSIGDRRVVIVDPDEARRAAANGLEA